MSIVISDDGLLFVTLQLYSPSVLPGTVSVWLYCAVTASSSMVSVSASEIGSEFLIQLITVGGPLVEMQVIAK